MRAPSHLPPLLVVVARGVVLLVLASLALPSRTARAEAPGARVPPVHVLALDSDDAEDQADALTSALRSRIRVAPGWSLQETQHSLGMLTAALRCPQRPDAACLQRIGDQLRTDHFVWGMVARSPGSQVTADVHLWARGKPDTAARETYSDNLKDQNDETLRRVAARIFERITGAATSGAIAVHAGDVEGAVWINGVRKQALEHGTATLEVPTGTYLVEVRATGFTPAQQEGVVVSAGQTANVTLRPIAATAGASGGVESGGGTDVQRIVAWSLVGVGIVGEVVAGVEGARFLSLRSGLNSDRDKIGASVVDVCQASSDPTTIDACSKYDGAKNARTVGVLVGGAGAVALITGIVLLVTDGPKEGAPQAAPPQARLRVLPYAAPRPGDGAGVNVSLTF